MRLRDRREPADERGDTERFGVSSEIGCDDPWVGRQLTTPSVEMREVALIGAARVVGDAAFDKRGNTVGDSPAPGLASRVAGRQPIEPNR